MNEKTAKYFLIAGGVWLAADIVSPFIGGQIQNGIDTVDGLNPLPIPLWVILAGLGAFGIYGLKGVAGVSVVWLGSTVALKSLVAKQAGA